MTDLLPCPFCGSEMISLQHCGSWDVECLECFSGFQCSTKEAAIDAWNTRPSPWISVDERLPENGEQVLAWTNSIVGESFGVWYYDEKAYEQHPNPYITHWQEIKGP